MPGQLIVWFKVTHFNVKSSYILYFITFSFTFKRDESWNLIKVISFKIPSVMLIGMRNILMRQILQNILFTLHLFVFVTSIRSARPQKIQMYWSKIHLDQFQVSFDPLNFTPSIFGCFCSAPDILNYTSSPKEDWLSLAFSVL